MLATLTRGTAKNLALLAFDTARIIAEGFPGEQEAVPAMIFEAYVDEQGRGVLHIGCARYADAVVVAAALTGYGLEVDPFDALAQAYDVEAVLIVTTVHHILSSVPVREAPVS